MIIYSIKGRVILLHVQTYFTLWVHLYVFQHLKIIHNNMFICTAHFRINTKDVKQLFEICNNNLFNLNGFLSYMIGESINTYDSPKRHINQLTAGLAVHDTCTKINFPKNCRCCNKFETTKEKLSPRQI